MIVTAPPDLPGPRRGKFLQMLPAPLIGLPLFFAVQMLHAAPIRLGLLLVPATFLAFLAMAWGKRGIPIAIAVMFSMIFSMATPAPTGMADALQRTLALRPGRRPVRDLGHARQPGAQRPLPHPGRWPTCCLRWPR